MTAVRQTGFSRCHVLLAALACCALAASPVDWVRQGNAAFARGEFAQAVHAYEQAEALVGDPGLVAFNLAGAHYELQHFGEAERYYHRALEDADGPRRIRALYGLGNALTRQGNALHGRTAVQRLLAAKQAYNACLAAELSADDQARTACADTFADARFNLRIAEQLLERKRNEAASEPPASEDDPNTQSPGDRKPERGPRPGDTEPDSGKKGTPDSKGPERPGVGQEKPQAGEPPPGKGNLPLLLDDLDAPALDAGAAREHLQSELERIRKERAQHATAPPGTSARVKDW